MTTDDVQLRNKSVKVTQPSVKLLLIDEILHTSSPTVCRRIDGYLDGSVITTFYVEITQTAFETVEIMQHQKRRKQNAS